MNNKIKKLTELRNSMWEQKLELGCELYTYDNGEKKLSVVIRPEEYIAVTDNDNMEFIVSDNDEILGTPLSILDITRMIKFIRIFKLEEEPNILRIGNDEVAMTPIAFDMEKYGEYIKDYPKEVIDKLLELFNIK